MTFRLHPILEADTYPLFELTLSKALLMNDCRFPWVILVPKRAEIREIYDLSESDQILLWQEVTKMTKWASGFFEGDKMNVATLGNRVPQLHIHLVVRKEADAAWPKPVWGHGLAVPYAKKELKSLLSNIKADDILKSLFFK
jgi:diadenosine tetraphosphate (Ap4A) HIT family hydrolase